MTLTTQQITPQIKLQRDSLVEGGFAGLLEHRLVKSPRVFGSSANDDGTWPGMGNFVYLADARFMPHGDTRLHSHHEIDVISVMVQGHISHEGSLESGQSLSENDVQVQRAGGEGFSHNEVNPDDSWNRMIQIWVLPEVAGQPASYKVYRLKQGESTRVYGG
ncbi:Pirin, partial [hydrothermal vent metagenome]